MQRLAWAFKIHLYLCGLVDQALLLAIDKVSLWILMCVCIATCRPSSLR